MEVFYIFLGFGVLLLLILLWNARVERQRREALQRIAKDLGMTFSAEGVGASSLGVADLRLFRMGRSRRFSNALVGKNQDVMVSVFDYRYVTGSGKNQSTSSQTVAGFQAEELALPAFELRPENVFHKIGQAFGYRDFDFPDYPEFSRRYILRGEDETAVRQLFDSELIRFVEGLKGVSIEGEGDRLIVYRARRRLKVAQIRECMDEGFRVYGRFRGQASS